MLQNILLLVPECLWGRPSVAIGGCSFEQVLHVVQKGQVFTVIHVECAARSKLEARLLTCQANPSRVSMVRGYM